MRKNHPYDIADIERMKNERMTYEMDMDTIAIMQNIFRSMQMFFDTGMSLYRKSIPLSVSRFPKFWTVKYEQT